MVYDDFECTFKCLHHPLCVSVNLAAEGDLWCELLSSDKYSNPNEYKEKKSSHHYFFEVRTIYTLVASLELYCFKKDLEKQKENAVVKRKMLLRARSRLKDSRKTKPIFYNSAEELVHSKMLCYQSNYTHDHEHEIIALIIINTFVIAIHLCAYW